MGEVLEFTREIEINPYTSIMDIKRKVRSLGWTRFEIEYDTDKDKIILRRVSKGEHDE